MEPDAPVTLHVYPREQTLLDRLREALYLQKLGGGRAGGALSPRQRLALSALGELARGMTGIGVALRDGPGRAIAAMPWVPTIR
jgi:hypothetical protein